MPNDRDLRKQLIELMQGGHAHATFDKTVEGFPMPLAGTRPPSLPHSAWELLEHMRITQHDILRFSQSADYVSPPWPQGYWPAKAAPESQGEWDESVRLFRSDRASMEKMVLDPGRDLYAPFSWGEGQSLLREALLVADHTSYHLGQLLLVRRALGAWPSA